jgi:hypothetical protein
MKAVTPLTDNSNIRLGYEVECYVKDRHVGDFEKAIKRIHNENIISDDGSIEPPERADYTEFCTYEIPTAVLPPRSAIQNLKAIFALLQEWGGTNETCGFHLNISSTDKSRMKRFNPIPFISSPLWNRLLRDFNRADCDYCLPVWDHTMSPMDQFNRLREEIGEDYDYGYGEGGLGSLYGKDSVVNLANWANGTRANSRIEIRGMGGNKYHYRLPLITEYTRRIMKLFMLCCDIPMIDRKRFSV